MYNNPLNASQEKISSFRSSVALLTNEWFLTFPSSASRVASYSPFFTGRFISPFQFMPVPTLWVSGRQTSAERDLTDPDDAYEGMRFVLLLWFSNFFYRERNSREKKRANFLTLVVCVWGRLDFSRIVTETDTAFINLIFIYLLFSPHVHIGKSFWFHWLQ